MADRHLVSIIIPVFNVRPYLAEALGSVLHQSYEALEILLIDDGSTDGSGAICDEYAKRDRRIRVVHQENRGLSAARNVGLDRMTGDVVAFLDPDDCYHPAYVELLLDALLRDQADLAVCKHAVTRSAGTAISFARAAATSTFLPAGIYGREEALRALTDGSLNMVVWNKLYRRELWDEIRFPEGHVYEDTDTTFRILDRCRMVSVLDSVLYVHRSRPGSITATLSEDNIRDRELACSHYDDYVAAHTPGIFPEGTVEGLRRKRVSGMFQRYLRYTHQARRRDEFSEALRALLLEEIRALGIEGFGPRTRLAYRILCVCPGGLIAVYPVYHAVWTAIKPIVTFGGRRARP